MTPAEHKARHEILEKLWDKIVGEWALSHRTVSPALTSMMSFMKWHGEYSGRAGAMHMALDEMMADHIAHTGLLLHRTSVAAFGVWIAAQAREPTESSRMHAP